MAKKPGRAISVLLAAALIVFVLAAVPSYANGNPAAAASYDRALNGTARFPSTMTAGQTGPVSIVMLNNGTTTWTPYYSLVPTLSAGSNSWGAPSVLIGGSTNYPPGSEKRFEFNITAPWMTGVYGFQWQMRNAEGASFPVQNPDPLASICVTPKSGCSDTDNGSNSVYLQGTCSQAGGAGCFVDECTGGTTVKEWECINKGCASSIRTCPSGYGCSSGKCVFVSSGTAVTQSPTQTPTPTPTPQPDFCFLLPDGLSCAGGVCKDGKCVVALTPTPTPTPISECPQPTTNSCCIRTYRADGACTPQDTPDNGKCSKSEYCGGACVCLSNKCSSNKDSDSCGTNPACAWCAGDGRCKEISEVACQPPGCNGDDLHCSSGCEWSRCHSSSSKCVSGSCVKGDEAKPKEAKTPTTTPTASPTATPTQPTVTMTTLPATSTPTAIAAPQPANASVDLIWGDWQLLSVVAGGKVKYTRGLKITAAGRPFAEIRTAWDKYAKEMVDAGWECTGLEWVSTSGRDIEMPQAVNCTRPALVTAEQSSNWTSDYYGKNNTITVQHVTSEVSVRNTDSERRYQDVKVEVMDCPPSFSCSEASTGGISAGENKSVQVAAAGNSIALIRTRGTSYEGRNYYESLEMTSSLGLEHKAVTGWIDLNSSRMAGTPSLSLQVITADKTEPADITPKSGCPQLDAFIMDGLTWKSCIGSNRYEFVVPVIGKTPVVVRLVGGAIAASGAVVPPRPVESITVSYPKSEVLQGSVEAVGSAIAGKGKEMPPAGQATPSTEMAGGATTTTTAITTITPSVAAPAENAYVRSIESIAGISVSADPSARASLEEETAKATSALSVGRIIEPSSEKSTVKMLVENKGGAGTLKNVVVFESVPKSVAKSAGEIKVWKVSGVPVAPRIVEDDPILAFVFESIPEGRIETIEYEVRKEIQSSGAKEYSAPVVLAYATAAGLKGGDGEGAFSFVSVFQKWIGGWIFWLIITFFSMVMLGSYLTYRWIRSKTE